MEEKSVPKEDLNTVVRLPKRGFYDEETIFSILDNNFLCHVAWQEDGQPHVIPTAYGRNGNLIYLHGNSKSRMLSMISDGRPSCIEVTELNAIVLARSIFHHSMNYRSAILYGKARKVEGDEKWEALKIVSDQILKGRWDEVRLPNEIEMKATMVVAFEIELASAKIRTGPPKDDAEDYELPIWAGIIPIKLISDSPETDPSSTHDHKISDSIQNLRF